MVIELYTTIFHAFIFCIFVEIKKEQFETYRKTVFLLVTIRQ